MKLFGVLRCFSLADLLQWASHDRAEGELVFWRPGREKRIYLEDGRAVCCLSSAPSESFGRYLLVNGLIDQQDLMAAECYSREQHHKMGESIANLGILTDDEVCTYLKAHIEDSICDLFLWQDGAFYMTDRSLGQLRLSPEPIDVVGVLLEGTRWIDETARIRAVLPEGTRSLRRGENWPGDELDERQEFVVSRYKNGLTLEEHYVRVGASYYRFLETIAELVRSDVFEIDEIEDEAPEEEISLLKLILDKAPELASMDATAATATPSRLRVVTGG